MISIFLNTSVLLRYICVLCPRSAMQKVPPYVFIAVTGYTLGASSDRSSRRRRCWHSDRHNNSQIPLLSPETQTRNLQCASRHFGTRSSYVWGSYSLLWLPTGTVLSANGDTILGFLCTVQGAHRLWGWPGINASWAWRWPSGVVVHSMWSYTSTRKYQEAFVVVFSLFTAQWSLYVPHSGHYMYRTVVTICTAQRSLYVPPV